MRMTVKAWLMLLVAGSFGAGQARADLISNTPYTLSMSESPAVLADPTNTRVAELAALTTGHVLGVERSEPYFLLTNTSDTSLNASIIQFQMTIGNTADHFRFIEGIAAGA